MNSPGTTAKETAAPLVRPRRITLPVWLVVVFGLLISVGLFLMVRHYERERFQSEFNGHVGAHLEVFTDQIDNYAELLYTLRSLFLYSDNVSRDEFRGVATDLLSRYLGIQALEWVPRVAGAERAGFETATRQSGYPDFQFTQRAPNGELVRAAERSEYWPIYYLEPYAGNEPAFGFDVMVGPNQAILTHARDTGEMHISEKIRLVQEADNQGGLVVLLPVYDVPEKTLLSPEERQAHFRGFVQSVYRIGDLMETTFRRLQGGVLDVMIIDQGAASTNRLIHIHQAGKKPGESATPDETGFRAGLNQSISYPIGGRRWEFVFRPTAKWLTDQHSILPLLSLLIGCSFTGILAAFVHGTVNRKEQVERTVQQRTVELSKANRQLQREIEERHQTETALLKSRANLLQAQRIGEIGSWELDLAQNKLTWSAETYRIFGHTPESFVLSRESFLKAVHPDDRNKVVQASADALAQGGNYWVEHRILRPDGTERFVREQAEVVRNDQGQAAQMAGTVQDITERKRAETALRQSESLYRGVFEATSDGMVIADCNGYIRAVNQSFCAMHGRTRDVCLELPLADFIEPTVWQRVVAFMQKEQWDEAFHALTSDQREDGTSFEVELTGKIINYQGNPHYLVVLRDVSERRRSEEAVARERNLLRTLIDSLPDDIYIKDTHGRYLMVNEANRKLLGLPDTESARGKSVYDFAPPQHAKLYAADDQSVMQSGQTIMNREEPFDLPGGGKGWFLTTKIPLHDSSGEIIGLIGISRDITERKREEMERHIMERKLQETQKLESLGVLAGGIAHDFNNLLTGILGNASLARLDLPPMSPVRPYLEQIESASQRAAELCKQMLAYSGKGRFVVQHLDLSALVEDTMHLLQLSISKKAVMRFNLTRNLPAVSADATQMRQIIMNLVINASDAIGDKSGVISICTGVLRADRAYLGSTHLAPELPEGDYVFLEVSDNGCGMTPDTLTRIFDPFFTTKFTGRGLGLAAVLGIVRGHKGALKVYTEVGRGSTFKMLLPCAEGPTEEFRTPVLAESPWRGEGTVLVVDDEETVRTVTARMLESFGFKVLMAADGREGVQRFREEDGQFACVMLDLTMPHLDGEETFREIRRIRPDTRVLLMSGFNEQDAVNRFSGKGLAGFIQKPFKLESLREKMRQILESPKNNL